MGDVGEDYRSWDEIKKAKKKDRLDSADDTGWTKHNIYHWSRIVKHNNAFKKLDYWPSTGLCRLAGKGHNIKSKFIQSKIGGQSNEMD